MKFKVTASTGIHFGGNHLKKGETFNSERKNPHIGTFLHFNQIEEADQSKLEPDAEAKAKADAKGK